MSSIKKSGLQSITSVGIDIGTTTTQLVISRLTIKNMSPGSVIPKMEIADREVLYRSDIHLTPIDEDQMIDADKIREIIALEYKQAGISQEDVETGAVIITGETAKKENARSILEAMAGFAGDFVVATAGANLESVLAGKGSGAANYSRENFKIVANMDVGGGTSNIGVFRNGKTLDMACVNIGGHLIEIQKNGDRVTNIAEPAQVLLNDLGMPLAIGNAITHKQILQIVNKMAEILLECMTKLTLGDVSKKLLMTPPLRLDYSLDTVMISGGVADYVYSDYNPVSVSDVARYGDIGPALGWAIRQTFEKSDLHLIPPIETIRATVIGAGIHSLEISGSTIHVNTQTLPLKNIAVIAPFDGAAPRQMQEVADRIQKQVERLAIQDKMEHMIAVAFERPYDMSYDAINELALGIVAGMKKYLTMGKPLIVVVEADCGKILGQCMSIAMGGNTELVCIDQVSVDEGDYIDIGKPIMGDRVVPVVVKTLVFDRGTN